MKLGLPKFGFDNMWAKLEGSTYLYKAYRFPHEEMAFHNTDHDTMQSIGTLELHPFF